jgi:hypothetical protein
MVAATTIGLFIIPALFAVIESGVAWCFPQPVAEKR